MAEVCLGLRVVRGPSWNWPAQDGGEGGVGTVVEVGGKPDSTSPLGTVVVLWDTGNKTNYRCGYDNKFDLRVFDTNCAPGAHHFGIMCDECKEHNVFGIRWKCKECGDYDLCNTCYHAGKHDLQHRFWSMPFPGVPRRDVDRRHGAQRTAAKGLFAGAQVCRGLNWRWGDQDGHAGVAGTLEELRNYEAVTVRSSAQVLWPDGQRHVYRSGHIGKVDIRCVELKDGGHYYREHLPILVSERVEECDEREMTRPMRPGDLAQMAGLEVEILKMMQAGHGGWSDSMERVMQQVGEIQRIDPSSGGVHVYYQQQSKTFEFHPAVVARVIRLKNGDSVKMIDDTGAIKAMLIGHGEWTDGMEEFKGQIGTVCGQMPKFKVRVRFGNGTRWIFHPGCFVRVKGADGDEFSQDVFDGSSSQGDGDGTNGSDERRLIANALAGGGDAGLEQLLMSWLADFTGLSPAAILAKSIQEGDVEKVRREVERHKSHMNDHIGEHSQTCLHIAAGLGMVEIMDLLIDNGAEISAEDKDGDQPMHYAVMGNEPRSIACLQRHGGDVNACNHKAATALHHACARGNEACVEEILRLKANVHAQDGAGDTPLHDAVAADQGEIVDMLLTANAPISATNDRGFNVMHHAALKGHHYIFEKLVRKEPEMVMVPKSDGWCPLHLGVYNGHVGVTSIILQQRTCQINARTSQGETPLILAVQKGSSACTELLVSYGADLDAANDNGNTALHTALVMDGLAQTVKKMRSGAEIATQQAMVLSQISQSLGWDSSADSTSNTAAIACFLAQEGCSLTERNNEGKTPLDICADPRVKELVQKFHKPRGWSSLHGSNVVGSGMTVSRPALAASSTAGQGSSKTSTSSGESTTATDGASESVTAPLQDCAVCENKANIRFIPCGHSVLCDVCSKRATRCPNKGCKVSITGRVKLEYVPAVHKHKAFPCSAAGPEDEACMMCDNKATVVFAPCGHVVTCAECCVHARKCIKCKVTVTNMTHEGVVITKSAAPTTASKAPKDEDAEIETCPICLDNKKEIAFMCGHRVCAECSPKLYECPICRKPITAKIHLFA